MKRKTNRPHVGRSPIDATDVPCPVCFAREGSDCRLGAMDALQLANPLTAAVGIADMARVPQGEVHLARKAMFLMGRAR